MSLICCKGTGIDDNETGGKFEIDNKNLVQDFEAINNSVLIPVNTNISAKDWTIESSNETWCIPTKENAGRDIRIYVKANEEPELREATVKVKSPVKDYTIQIRQLGYGRAILLSKFNEEISSEGNEISISVTANVEYQVAYNFDCKWISLIPKTKGLSTNTLRYKVDPNTSYDNREVVIIFSDKSDPNIKAEFCLKQFAKDGEANDVVVDSDIQYIPSAGQASSTQPGDVISNSWDGDFSTRYHAGWGSYTPQFPVTIEYFFTGENSIDYILYYVSGNDGFIGKFDLYVATMDSPNYTLVGDYDFEEIAWKPKKFNLASPLINVTKLKFVIKNGKGGYLACSEMQFWSTNKNKTLENQLLTVFTDICCTELKVGVTDDQINSLPGYFAKLAFAIRNNGYDKYDKQFRIQNFKPYSRPEVWAKALTTKQYTKTYDNPTGISVKAGDELIVLVGDTHGNLVSLQGIEEIENDGVIYLLESGVNKIRATKDGQLFFMYNTDIVAPTSQPIKVHFPIGSGTVNCYFDLENDKTDDKYYDFMTNKATHTYFAIKGKNVVLYFYKDRMQSLIPTAMSEYIKFWDMMIEWQYELMGINELRSQFNNHVCCVSPAEGYMWASDGRLGFGKGALEIFMPLEKMFTNRQSWGPAHEVGHIHQGAINWRGCTESSNNLFSNYTLYKIGKEATNGTTVYDLANKRCANKRPWIDLLGNATKADTELQMRMYWQLWIYFHGCGIKTDFYPLLFKYLREVNLKNPMRSPGQAQIDFMIQASIAANMDLTEFFNTWGFLIPVDMTIDQYGSEKYLVTQDMINTAKTVMSSYATKAAPFQFIEDRRRGDNGLSDYGSEVVNNIGEVGYYTQFVNKQKVDASIKYSQSGQGFSITNGGKAVGFEVYRGSALIYFSNKLNFDVPSAISIDNTVIVKAVQANGERIIIAKQ